MSTGETRPGSRASSPGDAPERVQGQPGALAGATSRRAVVRALLAELPPPVRGALVGIFLLAIALAALAAIPARLGFGVVGDILLAVLSIAVLAVVAGVAAHLVAVVIQRTPRATIAALSGVTVAAVLVLSALLPTPFTLWFLLPMLAVAGWVGGALAALVAAWRADRRMPKGPLVHAILAAGAVLLAVVWLSGDGTWRGTSRSPGAVEPRSSLIDGPNPALPGRHGVLRFSYGSGTDATRPEYARSAALRSPTADLRPFVAQFEGWKADVHEAYWKFDMSRAPLNARVWAPDGAGPFPLVVIVHGVHALDDVAEVGFGYLAELLASRGYMVVSIDENFLNGPWVVGMVNEVPARAWLVLRHLALLHEWAATPGTPFFGRLDLDRIALIGHSRGGEAVTLAAALNRLQRYPDDASIRLEFGFSIRSLIALAPSVDFYRPANRPVAPSRVSYLVLQGSSDADVYSFRASGQYQRIAIGPEAETFKAAVYIHGANHAQFNERARREDRVGPLAWLLNREPLLTPDVQRRITTVYVAAFLEATLRGDERYRPLFRDALLAGDWLPPARFVSRYDDGRTRLIASFEEDADPTTTTVPGGALMATNMMLWREETLVLRDRQARSQENHAARLIWGAPVSPASYDIIIPDSIVTAWNIDGRARLIFDIASASPIPEPIDFTIELVSADGVAARLPLQRFGLLGPPLQTRVWKPRLVNAYMMRGAERVLQSYELPLDAFVGQNPAFDPARIRAIRLRFDRTPRGAILLDDIGFRLPRPTPAPRAPSPAAPAAGRASG